MSRGSLNPFQVTQDMAMTNMAKATIFSENVLELGAVTVQSSAVKAAYGDNGGTATAVMEELSPEERDRLLLEHLPTVRFLARRIHERLPQHVDVDDLISAGVVGADRCVLEVRSQQEGSVQELRAVPDSRSDSGFAADAGLESA